ncbi:hypothetical protein MMC34_005768 [Xylographa carneopallida]|nr:hypothetical protein [Xylographa carneopallida]
MSLSVRNLNGDATFLLTFSTKDDQRNFSRHSTTAPRFSILLDPWLSGDSTIFHRKFALAKHTVPSSIDHLSEIPPPNVVLVSQEKSDHCHEATLRQLDPSLRHTTILAQPAAAKKIRGWKYFNASKVLALPIYSERRPDSVLRFCLPCQTPGGIPGEVTIAFITAKRDMTGLHNAIALTYRPPSKTPPFEPTTTFYKHDTHLSDLDLPLQGSPYLEQLPPTPPDSPRSTTDFSPPLSPRPSSFSTLPTTASLSPALQTTASLSLSSTRTYSPSRPRTLSVLYTPHGLPASDIQPYARAHLVPHAALPLTLLLHAFDRVQNAWYLGGTISTGLPGGLALAQTLLACHWISTHDEDKESSGFSVRNCVTRKHTLEEVRELVRTGRKGARAGIEVRVLECGEEMLIEGLDLREKVVEEGRG